MQPLKCDMPGDSSIPASPHGVTPPKHCFMYHTATKQQMELEFCVHDTALHPSEEEEMERNEMRYSRHLRAKHRSVALSHRGGRRRDSGRHTAFRVIGWFVLSVPVRRVRLELCSFPLFVYEPFIWVAPPLLPVSHSFYLELTPNHSLTSPSLLSVSPLTSSIFPSHLSASLSSPLPGSTVWKLDESDCMWQSAMWVNVMWLIWRLLTVEERGYSLTRIPYSHPAAVFTEAWGSVYLFVHMHQKSFSLWVKGH